MTRTRVLWLTRHKPTKAQINDLQKIFGPVELVHRVITIKSVQDVAMIMKRENCSEVVTVLPLTTLSELVESGIQPLISVMNKRGGQHKYFMRVKKIKVEAERLVRNG